MSNDTALISFVRKALLAILVFGLVGTEIELFLLKHTEDFWQLVPVVAIAATILIAAWCAVAPGRASLGTLRVVMGVLLIAGIIGTVQHFTGNVGYEKESNPGLGGMELYRLAMMGSTPLLAPGAMLQLGFIGLLYTYRHPAFTRNTQ